MLVVMPNGRAMKNDRAMGNMFEPEKVEAFANFEKDLITDLISFIEKTFPVLTDHENRALAGLSMGGGQFSIWLEKSGSLCMGRRFFISSQYQITGGTGNRSRSCQRKLKITLDFL